VLAVGADETAVRSLLPAADAALAWAEEYGDRDGCVHSG